MPLFAPDLRAAVEAYGGIFPPEFKKTTIADANPATTPRGFRPVGTIHQYIDELVDDIDSFKPGGTISILTGEAEPQIYNNPLVIESLFRAGDPPTAMIEHVNRGLNMGAQGRYEDALYDLDYATMLLMDKIGWTPEGLNKMRPLKRRNLLQKFGASIITNTGIALIEIGEVQQAIDSVLPLAFKYHTHPPIANAALASGFTRLGLTETANDCMNQEMKVNPDFPKLPRNWGHPIFLPS